MPEQVFEIHDYSVVTPWERLIADIECKQREWISILDIIQIYRREPLQHKFIYNDIPITIYFWCSKKYIDLLKDPSQDIIYKKKIDEIVWYIVHDIEDNTPKICYQFVGNCYFGIGIDESYFPILIKATNQSNTILSPIIRLQPQQERYNSTVYTSKQTCQQLLSAITLAYKNCLYIKYVKRYDEYIIPPCICVVGSDTIFKKNRYFTPSTFLTGQIIGGNDTLFINKLQIWNDSKNIKKIDDIIKLYTDILNKSIRITSNDTVHDMVHHSLCWIQFGYSIIVSDSDESIQKKMIYYIKSYDNNDNNNLPINFLCYEDHTTLSSTKYLYTLNKALFFKELYSLYDTQIKIPKENISCNYKYTHLIENPAIRKERCVSYTFTIKQLYDAGLCVQEDDNNVNIGILKCCDVWKKKNIKLWKLLKELYTLIPIDKNIYKIDIPQNIDTLYGDIYSNNWKNVIEERAILKNAEWGTLYDPLRKFILYISLPYLPVKYVINIQDDFTILEGNSIWYLCIEWKNNEHITGDDTNDNDNDTINTQSIVQSTKYDTIISKTLYTLHSIYNSIPSNISPEWIVGIPHINSKYEEYKTIWDKNFGKLPSSYHLDIIICSIFYDEPYSISTCMEEYINSNTKKDSIPNIYDLFSIDSLLPFVEPCKIDIHDDKYIKYSWNTFHKNILYRLGSVILRAQAQNILTPRQIASYWIEFIKELQKLYIYKKIYINQKNFLDTINILKYSIQDLKKFTFIQVIILLYDICIECAFTIQSRTYGSTVLYPVPVNNLSTSKDTNKCKCVIEINDIKIQSIQLKKPYFGCSNIIIGTPTIIYLLYYWYKYIREIQNIKALPPIDDTIKYTSPFIIEDNTIKEEYTSVNLTIHIIKKLEILCSRATSLFQCFESPYIVERILKYDSAYITLHTMAYTFPTTSYVVIENSKEKLDILDIFNIKTTQLSIKIPLNIFSTIKAIQTALSKDDDTTNTPMDITYPDTTFLPTGTHEQVFIPPHDILDTSLRYSHFIVNRNAVTATISL